jgi:hypothetical protein
VELYDAIGKGLCGAQAQPRVTMPWRDQTDAFPDKHRYDGDDEFIDRVLVEKGRDDFTPAHQPDILAGLPAYPFGKCADWLLDELNAGRRGWRGRPAGKHMNVICLEARAHLDAPVECLTAEDLGIDGPRKLGQTVEALWSRPARQPVETAIGAGDVAVSARRDVDDNLSSSHGATFETRADTNSQRPLRFAQTWVVI